MEKNNIKYLTFSICMIVVSLILNYNTAVWNNILYSRFDFTGIAKIIQTMMTLIILIISIICLIKSIQARKKGVDFLFNKFISIVFIIYATLSISAYIYVRSSEEKVALKMQSDIEDYAKEIMYEYEYKIKNDKNSLGGYEFKWTIPEALSQAEHAINDEYYERKKEIINQIENSSKLERYFSMLVYNFSYEHGSRDGFEIEYYGFFLKLFCVGLIGAIFYAFNRNAKDDTNIFYNNN